MDLFGDLPPPATNSPSSKFTATSTINPSRAILINTHLPSKYNPMSSGSATLHSVPSLFADLPAENVRSGNDQSLLGKRKNDAGTSDACTRPKQAKSN